MEKKMMSPINKGLIISLILVVISVVTYIAVPDMEQQQKFGWFNYVIIIGGLIWACITYSNDLNHNVTFGNLFAHGFKVTAVFTCITLVYTILAATIIFPEMKDKAMEVARKQMEANGDLNESSIDQALEMTRKFFVPFLIAGMLVGSLIIGAVGSLIGAAIAKKNPNPTPFESDNLS